jgi:GT2 family glycosyltransferase
MLSLIIANRNPLKWLSITAMYRSLLANTPHEIIPIHDATGLAEAYNRALPLAKGDLLAFSHDDIEFLHESFPTNLLRHLQTHDLIGLAGSSKVIGGGWGDARHPFLLGQIAQPRNNDFAVTFFGVHPTPQPAKILDGVFIACRRNVLDIVQFDPITFPHFHGYDADFSYCAHQAGFRVAVASDLFALHYSWGNESDPSRQAARHAFQTKHRLPPTPLPEGYIAATLTHSKPEALALMQQALGISQATPGAQ